ncbi:MAG: 3-dehydroquinate synthase [Acidimicrobiia bacterium]
MRRHVVTDGGTEVSEVVVGRSLLQTMVNAFAQSGAQRVAFLCQPTTRDLAEAYAQTLAASGIEASGYSLPDGEEAKQMAVVEEVYRHLNNHQFTRSDLIVGVGGGALTDVAGFVGGTYLRGLSVVYAPTTLLAAVDAAVGGKTGVNVDGKNLAGVFKHPESVFVDIDILDALPDAQKREGSAEALKTGFIADEAIVVAYERSGLSVDLEDVVNRSVAVKAAVVSEDFTERGRRAILNYGHTIGHAVEASTGRSHGDSVSIGMAAAGAASQHKLGFNGAARQTEVLTAIGLPVEAPDAHLSAVKALMALDKKRDGDGLKLVLLRAIEQPQVVDADDATLRAALDAVAIA